MGTQVGLTFYSPFSTLLVQEKLRVGEFFVKTKPASFRWNYRGPVYLREGQKKKPYCRIVAERHELDYNNLPRNAIVGVGNLVDVRPLSESEMDKLICCYNNVAHPDEIDWEPYCVPLPVGLFFDKVKTVGPWDFTSPSGAVHQFRFSLNGLALDPDQCNGSLGIDEQVPNLFQAA